MKTSHHILVVLLFLGALLTLLAEAQQQEAGSNSDPFEDNTLFEAWESWKIGQKKIYKSIKEHHKRSSIFAQNWQAVQQWNDAHSSGEEPLTLALNDYADLSQEEFRNSVLSRPFQRPPLLAPDVLLFNETLLELAPSKRKPVRDIASLDYRDDGAVTPVKNQGSCGSCWAFSIVGACEGANALAGRGLLDLSEQQLVDCSHDGGNAGCRGGDTHMAMRNVVANGLMKDADYPYLGRAGVCSYQPSRVAARFRGFVTVAMGNEAQLASVLDHFGPVSIAMDSSTFLFQFYSSGVFSDPACSPTRLNHGLVLVGYGPDYWLIKNSWGTRWGINGYMKIARNGSNACGVATYPLAPLVAA